jgi:hypothetical protein
MYSQDGYVFMAILDPSRPKFAASDLLSGTTEEEAQTEETYVSYCARYDFGGEMVPRSPAPLF